MFSQYKIIAGLVAVIFAGIGIYAIPEHYRDQGRQEVKEEYEKRSQTALNARLLENAQLAFEYQTKSRQMIKDFDEKLKQKDRDFNARINNDKRDGLRFKSACIATARKADPEITKRDHAEIEYRLPSRIENGLYGIVGKCNAVQDRLNLIIDKANELNLIEK
jgi:hypothetical protein